MSRLKPPPAEVVAKLRAARDTAVAARNDAVRAADAAAEALDVARREGTRRRPTSIAAAERLLEAVKAEVGATGSMRTAINRLGNLAPEPLPPSGGHRHLVEIVASLSSRRRSVLARAVDRGEVALPANVVAELRRTKKGGA